MTPTSSPHIALILDEKRNSILSILYTLACNTPTGKAVFEAACNSNGVSREDIIDFLEDWGEKEHELNWCKDPNCKRNKKDTL